MRQDGPRARSARRVIAGVAALTGLAAILATPAVLWAGSPLDPGRTVDYLHLEATEGGASGGHVALALADTVFHFERDADGLVRLAREDAATFHHRYAALGNRPIHVARVRVSDDTWARLREGFNTRYLVQRRQLEVRAVLGAERALLERLRAGTTDPAAWCGPGSEAPQLPRAGLLPSSPSDAPSAALARLRDRVAAVHGAGFLAEASAETRAALAALAPSAAPPAGLDPDALPADAPAVVERLRDLQTTLVAIAVLQDARPLRADALVAPVGDAFVLAAAERDALGRWAATLEAQLVRLADSPRPDRGAVLLAGMARLTAIETALARGRLVLVDAFPDGAPTLTAAAVGARPAAARELERDLHETLAAARAAFAAAAGPDERAYAGLEDAGNRVAELQRGLVGGTDVRLPPEPLLPSRGDCRADLPRPALAPAVLDAALARVADAERQRDEALRRRYGYALLSRNCVSEIFRTIDAALPERGTTAAAASAARLGGHVAGDGLAIVPFLSAQAVRDAWNVTSTLKVPSHRQAHVAALARRASPALVWLREGNTLTSTIYERTPDDSLFLFFTDDVVWPRPLLGAANLAVGVGASVAGLVLAPADRGATLSAGIRGVVFSLPELVFANVRKGSFEWVPRADLRDADGGGEHRPPG